MSEHARLTRLAGFLYGLAMVMFAGTMLELLAAQHFADPIQLIPFVLCAAGLVAVLLAWQRPGREAVQTMRGLMVLTAGASLLGVWKHIEGNLGFVLELHPDATGRELIVGGLTGRAPLLASGALAVTGVIAIAATVAAGWALNGAPPERGGAAAAPSLRSMLAMRKSSTAQ